MSRWRIRGGASQKGHARLRIFRPTLTKDRFRLVTQSKEGTVPTKRASSFRTSLRVKRGDILGLRTGLHPGDIHTDYPSAETEDQWAEVFGDPKPGNTVGTGGDFDYGSFSSTLLNISATLYRAPPETTITAHPAEKTTSRRARFKFRSDAPSPVTFKCRLDGARRFRPCESPRRYRDLSRGQHVFRVRAIDAGGHRDPSPAHFEWRITG